MTLRAPIQTRIERRRSLVQDVGQRTRLVVGQDTFFGPPGYGPDYHYPNPRGRPYPVALRTWAIGGLLLTTLAPSSQAPFRNADFPNPRAPEQPVALLQWEDSLIELPLPFAQSEHPNPVERIEKTALRSWQVNLLESTLAPAAGPAPFAQDEWPVPRGAMSSITLRTWTDELRLELLGKDVFFGDPGQPPANLDWQNPSGKRASIELRAWVQDLLQSTLAPLAPAPFAMLDWPLPRGRVPAIALRTWTDSLKVNLLSKDQFFGEPGQPPANMDWPNPRAAGRTISLWSWSVNLLQSTIAPPPSPEDVRIRFVAGRERVVFVSARDVQIYKAH